MVYKSIFELIGNTPIVEISKETHQLENVDLFCKLEYYNAFGSLKDRMALAMIKEHIIDLQKGKIVIENSSGNTAKALQIIASVYGTYLKTITNRIKNPEKKMILQFLGAKIEELPGRSQCYDPNDPNDPLVHVEREISAHPNTYVYTNQYFNQKNVDAHYQTTAKEIIDDLGSIDYFFSGVGTAGSTRGITQRLKEVNPQLKSIGIISAGSDVIPGIRNNKEIYEVGLFEKKIYDKLLEITALEAIDGSLNLSRKTGILIGPTGGASYQAIIKFFSKNPPKNKVKVVFLACDRFEWYLSYYKDYRPEIFDEQPKPNSIKSFAFNDNIVSNLNAKQVLDMTKNTDVLIIDIRSNIAFKFGHIKDSINIPEDSLEQILDNAKPFPKNKKLIFVCPNGDRSKRYAAYSRKLGYEAYNLDKGILGWKESNYPLEINI